MQTIIKNNYAKEFTCPHCKSIFTYEPEDVKTIECNMTGPIKVDEEIKITNYTTYLHRMVCPCCKKFIIMEMEEE